MTDSKPHFDVGREMLQQISQSFLEYKKMARAIENGSESLLPLTDHEDVKAHLTAMADDANKISSRVGILYRLIAREAAKP